VKRSAQASFSVSALKAKIAELRAQHNDTVVYEALLGWAEMLEQQRRSAEEEATRDAALSPKERAAADRATAARRRRVQLTKLLLAITPGLRYLVPRDVCTLTAFGQVLACEDPERSRLLGPSRRARRWEVILNDCVGPSLTLVGDKPPRADKRALIALARHRQLGFFKRIRELGAQDDVQMALFRLGLDEAPSAHIIAANAQTAARPPAPPEGGESTAPARLSPEQGKRRLLAALRRFAEKHTTGNTVRGKREISLRADELAERFYADPDVLDLLTAPDGRGRAVDLARRTDKTLGDLLNEAGFVLKFGRQPAPQQRRER
jgi:hypothetical protein